MLETIFNHLAGHSLEIRERSEGVAFLKAAKDLYGFSSIAYLGFNIDLAAPHGSLLNCCYSDTSVRHFVTRKRIARAFLEEHRIGGAAVAEWSPPAADVDAPEEHERSIAYPLTARGAETALIGIGATMTTDAWDQHKRGGMRDIRVLGNYFHSHILRINGHDAERDLIVSARELDCLKWKAAGKTVWEASVILGISERTVRFHLNAAREKLNCATTTQAVAKAISQQLIDVSGT